MKEEIIERINQLYHKSKTEGLTPEEKIEQAKLRNDYVMAIRNNLRGTLEQVSLLNPDGSITDLSKKGKEDGAVEE